MDLNLYILTANCARELIDVDLFAEHFFDPLHASSAQSFPAPELIVLSLQEIAPIAYSFLGGSYLAPYFEAFVRAVKKATVEQWNESYVNLVKDHTGMTGLMVFARADISYKISWIDMAHVGFGVQEMGNKGAVGARLGYTVDDDSDKTVDLTFVAAHLAPFESGLEQRNLDWKSIVERLVFSHPKDIEKDSNTDESTALLNHRRSSSHSEDSRRDLFAPDSYVFLAGDLNYRTSNVSPLKTDIVRFPRRDVNRDDPLHYSHLLKEDQLMREMRDGRSFHGLTEAPIDFPQHTNTPTQRAKRQSWASTLTPNGNGRVTAGPAGVIESSSSTVHPGPSDHRPVALAATISLSHAEPSTDHTDTRSKALAPFSIDPSWKSRRDAARQKELVVGVFAYLGLTWEGNGLLLASTLGLLGAWIVLRSLWEV
ncbi:Ferrochelatase [Penicillium atrosanguineum]|uniref:Ferrochelatase n=1 Tax=Penicillium atrosanguineum TaxID=1132637 RepID=UPI0023959AE3|nr:Ferrochelatase [Penicillium atrosanguineum]KAJ5303979.1 Ferrochelatase [Penicillium atrosanguineum]